MSLSELTVHALLFFILPLWLLAGFGDWLCHRRQDIAHTSGLPESILHLLLIAQGGAGVLAGLLLEINAGVLAFMLGCLLLHELTVWIDLRYSGRLRKIPPVEQMMHSLQEVLPLTAFILVALLHWDQFMALVMMAPGAQWGFAWKADPLPWTAIAGLLAACLVFALLPFGEEFLRCLRSARERRHGRDRTRANMPGDTRA